MNYLINGLKYIAFLIFLSGNVIANDGMKLINNKDYDGAFRASYAEALDGDYISQYTVGKILLEGLGTAEPNINQAMEYLKLSIKAGHGPAALYVARQYESGEFLSKNDAKALKYYETAKSLGVSKVNQKILTLTKLVKGTTSKDACKQYNVKDPKLSATLARCAEKEFIAGPAYKFWLINFDQGTPESLIKAANELLRQQNFAVAADKIINRIPEFTFSASDEQLSKMQKLILSLGIDSSTCEAKKNSLGFANNVDPQRCALAAAAGEFKAIQNASSWWMNGENGLPKNKQYAKYLLDELQKDPSSPIDPEQILKNYEGEPREHWKLAKQFLQDNPLNIDRVSNSLKTEIELIAEGAAPDFAQNEEDVVKVLEIINWNSESLSDQLLAKALHKLDTDYADQPLLQNKKILTNRSKLQFKPGWVLEVAKIDTKLAKKYVDHYIFEDCNALTFAFENISLVTKEKLADTTMVDECKANSSLAASDNPARFAIELMLEFKDGQALDEQCEPYGKYLRNKKLVSEHFTGIMPPVLLDPYTINEVCNKVNGNVAYFNAMRLIDKKQSINSTETKKSYELASVACDLQTWEGCNLASYIVNKHPTRLGFPEGTKTNSIAEKYAYIGWEDGKNEVSRLHIYDLMISGLLVSKKEMAAADKLLDELLAKGLLGAEIRNAKLCISPPLAKGIKLFGPKCREECSFVRKHKNNEDLDIGSKDIVKSLLNSKKCRKF